MCHHHSHRIIITSTCSSRSLKYQRQAARCATQLRQRKIKWLLELPHIENVLLRNDEMCLLKSFFEYMHLHRWLLVFLPILKGCKAPPAIIGIVVNWIIEWVAQRKFSPINLHRLFSFHFRRSGKALIKQANNHFSRFFIRSRSDIGLRVFKYEFDIWMIVNIFLRSQCSGVSQRLGSLARDRLENSVKTALVNNRWPFKALKRFSVSLQASNYF